MAGGLQPRLMQQRQGRYQGDDAAQPVGDPARLDELWSLRWVSFAWSSTGGAIFVRARSGKQSLRHGDVFMYAVARIQGTRRCKQDGRHVAALIHK